VKQEASGLTLIYFGTPVSGLATAGSAANWGAEASAAARLVCRGAGDSCHGRACRDEGSAKGWLMCWPGRPCVAMASWSRWSRWSGSAPFSALGSGLLVVLISPGACCWDARPVLALRCVPASPFPRALCAPALPAAARRPLLPCARPSAQRPHAV
jgi:hypothetical protein